MADRADRGNAHVRGQRRGKRAEPEVAAAEAQRLLDDPAFTAGVNRVRDGLVAGLESIKSDGSAEGEAYEREICRALRTLKSVTRAINTTVQGQALRLADFRPRAVEDENEGD